MDEIVTTIDKVFLNISRAIRREFGLFYSRTGNMSAGRYVVYPYPLNRRIWRCKCPSTVFQL